MMAALGLQTRPAPRYQAGPDRPPPGGNGTHTHGGGGGSNYPFSGWKHYVFGARRLLHSRLLSPPSLSPSLSVSLSLCLSIFPSFF